MENDAIANHLKTCKIDEKKYKKVVRRLNKILKTCETIDELLIKFAAVFCRKEPDRKIAKEEARVFLETLFGSTETLLNKGPYYALETLLNIRMVNVKEPDDRKEAASNPMWTKRFKNYIIGPTLGKGKTAIVKLAMVKKTQTYIALKILDPEIANEKAGKKELSILKDLNHKNIVRVYDYFENVRWGNANTTILAIEYACQGELIEYLMYTGKFEDRLARWFFRNLTDAVEYCHEHKIVHRDLKLDHCLLGKNFVLKITDFGYATYDDEKMNSYVGTKGYAAPEVLRGDKYTASVDIFSMGVMLFIALAGTQPWREARPYKDRWYKMVHRRKWREFFEYHKRSHIFSRNQEKILMGMLEPEHEDRYSLHKIKQCNWFQGITITQDEAAKRLQNRKIKVDEKKFMAMQRRGAAAVSRKAVDIFSTKLPYVYFQPPPPLSFVTDMKAEWVLEDIASVIMNMKGTIKEEEKAKYKLTFHINRMVDIGVKDKKTNKKQFEKVRVPASVQMWILPGQEKALLARRKALTAAPGDMDKLTEKEKEAMAKSIPKIKSIAVFRSEGDSEAKYLFPEIYSDLLEQLNGDLICKDVFYNNDLMEESEDIL